MAGKPRAGSLRSEAARLTEELGFVVSVKMVRVWKSKGFNLSSTPALLKSLGNQERRPAALDQPKNVSVPAGPVAQNEPAGEMDVEAEMAELQRHLLKAADYNEGRAILVKINGLAKIHELQVERGKFVSYESQLAEGMRIGQAVRTMFLKMEGELTPQVAGRDAAEVSKILKNYSREKLVEFGHYESLTA